MTAMHGTATAGAGWRTRLLGVTMTLALLLFLVEGALLACSVFQQEVQWKTLPSLWMLPTSMLYVAWSKVAGCLFGLLPVAAWFVFGTLCAPRSFDRAVNELVDEPALLAECIQLVQSIVDVPLSIDSSIIAALERSRVVPLTPVEARLWQIENSHVVVCARPSNSGSFRYATKNTSCSRSKSSSSRAPTWRACCS